jgi:hypothetical protein
VSGCWENRLESTQALIQALESDRHFILENRGIPISALIDSYKGGNDKSFQGFWIHPDLGCPILLCSFARLI